RPRRGGGGERRLGRRDRGRRGGAAAMHRHQRRRRAADAAREDHRHEGDRRGSKAGADVRSQGAAVEERGGPLVRARFGEQAVVVRLTGDASDRSYFRLKLPSMSSLILMVHSQPFELEALPWFVHGRFLLDIGASLPQVVASYPSEGILVIQ